jgi:uncharacterized membrane protein YkoI
LLKKKISDILLKIIKETNMPLKNNQQGIAHLMAVLAVVVVAAIGGTGYYVAKHQKSNVKNSETVATEKTSLASPLPASLLAVDKVKELATTQKPNSSIQGVQLENEEGVLVYKVKLADGTVLAFNATTGALLTNTVKGEFEGITNIPTDMKATIDFAKARSIALAQQPKGTVQKIELELEEGTLVYSVRFTDGGRVDVNATDGTVLKTKTGNKTDAKSSSNGSSSSTEIHKSSTSGGNKPSSSSSSGSHDSTETKTSTTPETEIHNSTTDDSSHGGSSVSGNSGSGHGSSH